MLFDTLGGVSNPHDRPHFMGARGAQWLRQCAQPPMLFIDPLHYRGIEDSMDTYIKYNNSLT